MNFSDEQGFGYAQGPYAAPTPYGAVADVANHFLGERKTADNKGTFLRGQRRRMNVQPMFLSVLAPWALFSVVYAALSFSLHYQEPGWAWGIVLAAFGVVVLQGVFAFSASGRWFVNAEREPTWLGFLCLSLAVALVAAVVLGSANYASNLQPYFNMRNLANYTNVDATKMRGQQLMDAGILEFSAGTRLDTSRSMGFKNGKVYCVAPITVGQDKLATYDFWAVGNDCCSGMQANFHCPHFNNPYANGGLRLMSDEDRVYYRLAVQQAEAQYNITAVHPLFFEWAVNPHATVESWATAGRTEYLIWMMSYLVFQTFVVAVAALSFAKLGFN